jgi:hypothetical protein
MATDPLVIGALTICGFAWLMTATVLTLDVLGRLPAARKKTVRSYRLQATTGLVAMTTVLLSLWGTVAHWADPIRKVVSVLTILAAISTLAAVAKALAIQAEAKRTQAARSEPPR